MKPTFLGLCICLLLGDRCLLAGLNDGLVAYYPFNGNANDASGNGFDGIVYGAALAADRFGNSNACYQFTGNGEWIHVNIGPAYFSADFAISAWVNFSDFANSYPMIVSGDYYYVHCHGLGSVYGNKYQHVTYYGSGVGAGSEGGAIFSSNSFRPNQWYYLCVTRQGADTKMYVNGVVVGEDIHAPIPSTTGSQLQFGNDFNSGSSNFHGMLDDIRIYNRALSPSEVQQLYSLSDIGPAPTPPTLAPTNRTPTSAEIGTQTNGSFKVFQNGAFTNGVALDPGKLTIVLTHGWNSSSDDWPSNMASQFVAAGISANIVAWDWRNEAKSATNLLAALKILPKTQSQGFALGTNLLQSLGAGYSQPVHFIGHSFGTLVNAAAANYLHGDDPTNNPPQPLSPQKTQMTLLDEADIANDFTPVIPADFNLAWIKALPQSFAWSDNYVSAVGELQEFPNVVNVILTKNQQGSLYSSVDDLWNALAVYHGTPCEWYGETITNPAGSVMGNIWSFERNSSFSSPAPGTFFLEQNNGLALEQINQSYADKLREIQVGSLLPDAAVSWVLDEIHPAVSIVGDVTANVIERVLTDSTPAYQTTPATIGISTYAPATPDFWSPQLMLQNHPSNPASNLKPLNFHPLDDSSSTPSNSPAYAWLPMTIPTNATSISFDFALQGYGAGDLFVAALNGTNVFSLATSLIQTNITMNSGLIDVSSYAGQNVELFLGIVGGASTNTILTVSGIRLYSVMPPLLQAQMSANNFLLSWPLSTSDYVIQISTNLTGADSWTAVPNVPAIVNLQNTITNPIASGQRFYRLIRSQ